MTRVSVIFENAPLESAPWITEACRACRLELVDNDEVATWVGKNPDAQKLILEGQTEGPYVGPKPELSAHYRTALEKVAGGKSRLGLHGVNWLLYGEEAAACVLDFDGLEDEARRGIGSGIAVSEAHAYVKTYSAQLRETAEKHLGKERVLVLPKGEPDARKAELASAFVRRWAP